MINSRQKGFESKRLNLNSAKMPPAPGGRSFSGNFGGKSITTVSYTHLRAHETVLDLVCRLLLEKKNKTNKRRQHIRWVN